MTNDQILLCASWCLFLLLVLPRHPKVNVWLIGARMAYLEWRLERAKQKYIKLIKHRYVPFEL